MRNWFLFVTSCVLLFTGNCLFAGDSCVGEEDRPGSCQPVSECPHLVDEIRQAGAPMPAHIRRQLQELTCGFRAEEPMVCCAKPYTNNNPDWTATGNHGMGGDWGTTQEPSWNNNEVTSRPDRIPDLPSWDSNQVTRPDRNIPDTPSWNSNQVTRPDRNRPDTGTGSIRPTPTINLNNDRPPNIQGHRNLRLLPTNCGVLESDRIWGGNRTRLYEMPWMVLVKYDSARGPKLSCGGTLITERYVLTAAHCVSFLGTRLTLNAVVLGEYDVRQDPDCETVEGDVHCAPDIRNVTVDRVIVHPGYSPQTLYDDIALVRLAERADFSLDTMKPICLPTTNELQSESLVGKSGVVAGWGATEDGLQSPVLLSVDLPVIENRECQERYNGNPQIYPRQLCAGGVAEKDSCGGDSGGPLMYPGRISTGAVRFIQRGIVSYGSKRCGLGGFPGVYTRVSHYMDWILDNID